MVSVVCKGLQGEQTNFLCRRKREIFLIVKLSILIVGKAGKMTVLAVLWI